MEKQIVKVDEAAQMLGLTRRKVYELVNSGELPSLRVGRSIQISVSDLERRMNRTMQGSGEEAHRIAEELAKAPAGSRFYENL